MLRRPQHTGSWLTRTIWRVRVVLSVALSGRLCRPSRRACSSVSDESATAFADNCWPQIEQDGDRQAANDNCFYRWLIGPCNHFELAGDVRRQIEELRDPRAPYLLEDRISLLNEHR